MRSHVDTTAKCAWMRLGWLSLSLLLSFLVETHAHAKVFGCPNEEKKSTSTILKRYDPKGQNFGEISGVALSPTQKAPSGQPVMFAMNDSGGGKRLGIYDSGNGKRLLTLKLSFLNSDEDYESLTIGSCGGKKEKSTCLYIGDVGDNIARETRGKSTGRKSDGGSFISYRIHKILEPPIKESFEDNDELPLNFFVGTMKILYQKGPKKYVDCEAVFVDHTGWGFGGAIGDLYLIGKNPAEDRDLSRVYKIPAAAWNIGLHPSSTKFITYSPQPVGKTVFGGRNFGNAYTGADMSWDGTLIGVGEHYYTYLFLRCPGMSVAEALSAKACHTWDTPRKNKWEAVKQYEAISWRHEPDGKQTILQVSESRIEDPPLVWMRLNFGKGSQMCEQAKWTLVEPHSCSADCTRLRKWQCILSKRKMVVSGAICKAHGLDKPSSILEECSGGACADLAPEPPSPESAPSKLPTIRPSTVKPSPAPSPNPSNTPTMGPSSPMNKSAVPSPRPLTVPPSTAPSLSSSVLPSATTDQPTLDISLMPSLQPWSVPPALAPALDSTVLPSSVTEPSVSDTLVVPSPQPVTVPPSSVSELNSSELPSSLTEQPIPFPLGAFATSPTQPSSSQARLEAPLFCLLLSGVSILGIFLMEG
eukprot:scaffold86627_cov54-Attheya_sp.AAC.1